jgi:magnesium chelatase subunit H
MRMLRRLPKILRFIPGTAQDVRAYFLTLQYWLAGSEDNVGRMVHFLVDRYADGPRARCAACSRRRSRWTTPSWASTTRACRACRNARPTCRAWPPAGKRGTVGLLLLRSYLLAGNAGHYDGVITALEARGLRVLPVFATGLDARPAIEKFFFDAAGRPLVDAVVSLTGFSLVGGPAYNDAAGGRGDPGRLDVPYVAVTPVEFQSLDQWGGSERGLLPVEAP